MSEDPGTGPDSFVVSLPLWLCVRTNPPTHEIIGGTLQGGGRFITVFTDRGIAEKHLEERGLFGQAQAVDILDPSLIDEMLAYYEKTGCTHVIVDDPGKRDDTGVAVPIAALIEQLRRDYGSNHQL